VPQGNTKSTTLGWCVKIARLPNGNPPQKEMIATIVFQGVTIQYWDKTSAPNARQVTKAGRIFCPVTVVTQQCFNPTRIKWRVNYAQVVIFNWQRTKKGATPVQWDGKNWGIY
jgi:hypothetical protein